MFFCHFSNFIKLGSKKLSFLGITESISLQEDGNVTTSLISKLLSMTSIVTAVLHNENTNILPMNDNHTSSSSLLHKSSSYDKLINGIHLDTNYRITAVQRLERNDSCPVLIKLHNPLISSSDYQGSYSRGSPEWNRLTVDERNQLSCVDGEFWINFYEFMDTFSTLEVIHLDSETSKDEPSLRGKCPWNIKFWRGN